MKHAIITACDANYGDFLTKHWLISLLETQNMKKTDIVVIDYGLKNKHLEILDKHGVKVHKGKNDGFVNAIKFRDAYAYLVKHRYDQIMTVDSGDLIFQTDILPVLEKDKDKFRAVTENFSLPFEKFLGKKTFSEKDLKKIIDVTSGKRMINCGVLIAPYDKFLDLCSEACDMMKSAVFGTDQIIVNYILHRDGFVDLPDRYNFMIATTKNKYYLKDGKFYSKDDGLISIVHNVGKEGIYRPIRNFGYGKDRNQINHLKLFFQKLFIRAVALLRR